jgi:hypothetical protein
MARPILKALAGGTAILLAAQAHAAPLACDVAAKITVPGEPGQSGRAGAAKFAYRLSDGSVVFLGSLKVDADGAPRAYHPDAGKGLDRLANAGRAGNWWGLATDTKDGDGDPTCKPSGKLVRQGPRDPAPGYYVSTTTMTNPAQEDCRRQAGYVDATAISYVALPPAIATFDYRHHAGALAVVSRRGGMPQGAVFADEAPPSGMGEGSIALARRLGYDADARAGGTESREDLFVVFTDTAHFPQSQKAVEAAADAAFRRWGGTERLRLCARTLAKLPK